MITTSETKPGQSSIGDSVNRQLLENHVGQKAKVTFKGSTSERGVIKKIDDRFYVNMHLIDINQLQGVQSLN